MAPRRAPRRSVNEVLQDRAIRHATFLERLKAGEAARITAYIEKQMIPSLMGVVSGRVAKIRSRGYDSGPWATEQYREMLRRVREVGRASTATALGETRTTLAQIARGEVAWQTNALSQSIPLIVDVVTPSLATVSSIVNTQPIQGKLLRGWFDSLSRVASEQVAKQTSLGFLRGATTDQIGRSVAQSLNVLPRHGRTIARTAINQVSTAARQLVFEANDDVIESVQFVATLDGATTDICASLDGKVFKISEGPRPPMHPQCRSTTSPITKAIEEILGIKKLRGIPEATRASMNGQIPAKVSFGPWLKRQPGAVQDKVLGRGRATLFRKGLVPIERFVSSDYRSLSLAEVLRIEGIPESVLRAAG